jgi:hypothetical protein
MLQPSSIACLAGAVPGPPLPTARDRIPLGTAVPYRPLVRPVTSSAADPAVGGAEAHQQSRGRRHFAAPSSSSSTSASLLSFAPPSASVAAVAVAVPSMAEIGDEQRQPRRPGGLDWTSRRRHLVPPHASAADLLAWSSASSSSASTSMRVVTAAEAAEAAPAERNVLGDHPRLGASGRLGEHSSHVLSCEHAMGRHRRVPDVGSHYSPLADARLAPGFFAAAGSNVPQVNFGHLRTHGSQAFLPPQPLKPSSALSSSVSGLGCVRVTPSLSRARVCGTLTCCAVALRRSGYAKVSSKTLPPSRHCRDAACPLSPAISICCRNNDARPLAMMIMYTHHCREGEQHSILRLYCTDGAAAATRGQASAHSFATGPVIAEPIHPQIISTKLPANLPSTRKRTLHLALVVDNHARVVCHQSREHEDATPAAHSLTLKVDVHTLHTVEDLALTDNHGRMHCSHRMSTSRPWSRQTPHATAPFLRRSGLPFLTDASTMSPTEADGRRLSAACAHASLREPNGARTRRTINHAHLNAKDAENVQVLGARVVGAVHDGRHRQTRRDLEAGRLRSLGCSAPTVSANRPGAQVPPIHPHSAALQASIRGHPLAARPHSRCMQLPAVTDRAPFCAMAVSGVGRRATTNTKRANEENSRPVFLRMHKPSATGVGMVSIWRQS